jgi:hypothetical protein
MAPAGAAVPALTRDANTPNDSAVRCRLNRLKTATTEPSRSRRRTLRTSPPDSRTPLLEGGVVRPVTVGAGLSASVPDNCPVVGED